MYVYYIITVQSFLRKSKESFVCMYIEIVNSTCCSRGLQPASASSSAELSLVSAAAPAALSGIISKDNGRIYCDKAHQ